MPFQTIIVGAGIAGLSAAWELTRTGHPVTVLEASGRAGGVIASRAHEGFLAEQGPDSYVRSKPEFAALCRELGIEDEIIAAQPQPGGARVLHRGSLQPLPAGWRMIAPTRLAPVLRSPLFPLAVKWAALRHWRGRRGGQGEAAGEESIATYLRRRFGDRAGQAFADTVAGPMAAGVYGGDAEHLRLPPLPPAAPAGAAAAATFASLRGGMGALVTALQAQLPPGVLHLGTPVAGITAAPGGGFQVHPAAGPARAADAVIVATPAWRAAELLADLDTALAAPLAAIPYGSSLNLNLGYAPAPVLPPGYGFLAPRAEGYQLLACTFAHQKFPHRAPPGAALVRVFYSGAALAHDDDAAVALARRELRAILGITAAPVWTHLQRAPRSLPQYTVGHGARLAALQHAMARHPQLALAGSAYQGVGVPDCIASGRAAARRVAAALP